MIQEWFKELLIDGIISNLTGMFDTLNTKVGEIADQMFDCWTIPSYYPVFGHKADLVRLQAMKLCVLDVFYVDE